MSLQKVTYTVGERTVYACKSFDVYYVHCTCLYFLSYIHCTTQLGNMIVINISKKLLRAPHKSKQVRIQNPWVFERMSTVI